ncbi:MAG TPA: alpha/beta hydrolase [Thermomicrobiales bacterium]|jgi:phospholipase/carboxylesterase|nr:alpha/beta hydrolase [Thermomicrobiales bacterium]
MPRTELDFVHRYIPPNQDAEAVAGITLLALHGTGGDETDLIPLAQAVLPGAGVLSPRGKVLEGNAPRFFRRLAEGVLDQEDLKFRTTELVRFVEAASAEYGFDRGSVVAVGFSNGANIAASILLREPNVLRGAALLSPMLPFEPESTPDLSETDVFIGAGRADPLVPVDQVKRLSDLLKTSGANVTLHWDQGGHTISPSELKAAQKWAMGLVEAADQFR